MTMVLPIGDVSGAAPASGSWIAIQKLLILSTDLFLGIAPRR